MPRSTASQSPSHVADIIGEARGADVYLAGDVFYDKAFADRLVPWFNALAARRADRSRRRSRPRLLPAGTDARCCATYQVPVTRALEDSEIKRTTVWRFPKVA